MCRTVNRYCCCCLCIFTFHCFPSFTIFCHFDPCVVALHCISFRRFSFLGFEEFVNLSSHLFFGLPTGLFVWYLVLRPGFYYAAFFVHSSSGSDPILTARRHYILLCVSTQHGILASCILSMAIAVLFLCSTHSSASSITNVSIHMSLSSRRRQCLGSNVCLYCYHHQFHHLSLCDLLFHLLHFPHSCWSAFSFCIFSLSG